MRRPTLSPQLQTNETLTRDLSVARNEIKALYRRSAELNQSLTKAREALAKVQVVGDDLGAAAEVGGFLGQGLELGELERRPGEESALGFSGLSDALPRRTPIAPAAGRSGADSRQVEEDEGVCEEEGGRGAGGGELHLGALDGSLSSPAQERGRGGNNNNNNNNNNRGVHFTGSKIRALGVPAALGSPAAVGGRRSFAGEKTPLPPRFHHPRGGEDSIRRNPVKLSSPVFPPLPVSPSHYYASSSTSTATTTATHTTTTSLALSAALDALITLDEQAAREREAGDVLVATIFTCAVHARGELEEALRVGGGLHSETPLLPAAHDLVQVFIKGVGVSGTVESFLDDFSRHHSASSLLNGGGGGEGGPLSAQQRVTALHLLLSSLTDLLTRVRSHYAATAMAVLPEERVSLSSLVEEGQGLVSDSAHRKALREALEQRGAIGCRVARGEIGN